MLLGIKSRKAIMEEISVKTQMAKINSFHKGFFATLLINIGAKLDIFKALNDAKEGITVSDLAATLGLHEPYLKFWCQTAYFFEILDCDQKGQFKFQTFMDKILGDTSNLNNLLAMNQIYVNIEGERLKDSIECYRTGELLDDYTPERSESVAEGSKITHRLLGLYFSSLPEDDPIRQRLDQGAKCLDIGCGAGGLIIQLAQSFKNSRFIGIDPVPHGIETGKKMISKLGLEDRISLEHLGGEEITWHDEFDIIDLVGTFHEILPDIRIKVVENAYEALKKDGQLLVIDFSYPGKIEDFRNSAFELGIMDQFFEAQIGTVILNEVEVNQMFTNVGFKNIQRRSIGGGYILIATK
jgi:ubiquinone/menaquinone biosynthesis C-methylase UbiE